MVGPSAMIFVLPGGGYAYHADHEAEPVAEWLESLGYRSSALRYPVAPTLFPAALTFVCQAITDARSNFDGPIGVLGFSAGGHLAGLAALAASDPTGRPDFAVLSYPVVSMGTDGHEGSRRNLLGEDAPAEIGDRVSLDLLVTGASVPFFIWHTADDKEVPASHSLRLASALQAHESPYELHVFPHGQHGLAMAEGSGLPETWRDLCAAWLAEVTRRWS